MIVGGLGEFVGVNFNVWVYRSFFFKYVFFSLCKWVRTSTSYPLWLKMNVLDITLQMILTPGKSP